MERFATYQWMAQPLWLSGEPLPPSVASPSRKSVGARGSGGGFQRSGLGEGATLVEARA